MKEYTQEEIEKIDAEFQRAMKNIRDFEKKGVIRLFVGLMIAVLFGVTLGLLIGALLWL